MRNPLAALAVTAERAAAELAAELSCEEVRAVQDWIVSAPEEAAEWLHQNQSEIDCLVCAPASKRRSRASLRTEPRRARLLYWAAVQLERGARAARVLASVPLPETASFDRSLLGAALSLGESADRMQDSMNKPCWSADGEWWP